MESPASNRELICAITSRVALSLTISPICTPLWSVVCLTVGGLAQCAQASPDVGPQCLQPRGQQRRARHTDEIIGSCKILFGLHIYNRTVHDRDPRAANHARKALGQTVLAPPSHLDGAAG